MDDQIKELFATLLRVSPDCIEDQTSPLNLDNWDSIQHLIVVAAFEEEFGLDLDPEDAVEMYRDFRTFREIVRQRMASGR